MNPNEIKSLVKIVEVSDVDSLEVKRWFRTIRITKRRQLTHQPDSQYVVNVAKSLGVPKEVSLPQVSNYHIIRPHEDHCVGVFYLNDQKEGEPVVNIGDRVEKGQVMGYIEAMNHMSEIESPYSGIVDEILVEPGRGVDFLTDLVRLRGD